MMLAIQNSKNKVIAPKNIGGKAKGLLFLQKNRFAVPPFYLIDYDLVSKWKKNPTEVQISIDEWAKEEKISKDALWAIRSSADAEDGADQSFAGIYTTICNVKTKDLLSAIKTVLNDYQAIDSKANLDDKSIGFGIIIQKMVQSDYSGVIFSHNPLNNADKTIQINLIPGIGENLVSGKETPFVVKYVEGKIVFEENNTHYFGEAYNDGLHRIKKSADEVKKEISPFLPELIRGTQKLTRITKQPVDIEFSIALGSIHWLQVRPITTGREALTVWDNTASEANFPGITMPLSISMATHSFYMAYKSMARTLWMSKSVIAKNEHLLQNMSGEINGGLYYNVSAWQKLIYQLPFGKKASKQLPKIWGMETAHFNPEPYAFSSLNKVVLLFRLGFSFFFFKRLKRRYTIAFKQKILAFDTNKLNQKNHEELIAIYSDIEFGLGKNWEAPMINGFLTLLVLSSFKKMIQKSRLSTKYPNFMNDVLFSQKGVISIQILQTFQSIVLQIQNDPTLKHLFCTNSDLEIMQQIKNTEIYFRIEQYLTNYGDRCLEGELKMETISYKENPQLFISYLKTCVEFTNPTQNQQFAFNYREILKKEYSYSFVKRLILKIWIRQVIYRVRDRENFRFMRTQTFALVRKIFRAIDKELLSHEFIDKKGDSLYLLLDEIRNPQYSNAYKSWIKERKNKYQKYSHSHLVSRYTQKGNNVTPTIQRNAHTSDFSLSGIGCSGSVIKGLVQIVDEHTSPQECENKILIANYFEPGKLNLFYQAAGLISVRGNLLSHTAILCREMGIPSIVCAKGILSKVKNGDWIEMDGASGNIKLLSANETI